MRKLFYRIAILLTVSIPVFSIAKLAETMNIENMVMSLSFILISYLILRGLSKFLFLSSTEFYRDSEGFFHAKIVALNNLKVSENSIYNLLWTRGMDLSFQHLYFKYHKNNNTEINKNSKHICKQVQSVNELSLNEYIINQNTENQFLINKNGNIYASKNNIELEKLPSDSIILAFQNIRDKHGI
jgi:hypothetical protein